jgi:alginate O-acetyltransferase complex protein AlgI
LPIAILGFYFIGYFRRGQAAFIWLVVCSYFFYGWWNYNYLPLLVATTVFNFFIGRHAGNLWQRDKPLARRFVALGIVLNLGTLFYFKYTDLAVRTIDDVFRAGWHVPVIVLPLGISFFTFQKIAYLADVGKDGRSEAQFLNYALFVSFFPQLIAGPIVHPKDVLPQFARHPANRMDPRLLAMGLTIFAIGLFKKTVLADTIAPFANLVFDAAFHGQPIAVADA